MTSVRALSVSLLAAIVLLLPVAGSARGAAQPAEPRGNAGVNVYLLRRPDLDSLHAAKLPLGDLPLRETPWIATTDIERYDASAHCFYLKQPVSRPQDSVALRGTPFVVTADGQRCYLGVLWPMISSVGPPQGIPMITTAGRMGSTDFVGIEGPAAVLNDERLLAALKRDGQFSAGIECSLDRVDVLPAPDGASIRYTFTVRNRDRDALYVPDTDRMDYDYFRRYQNGIAAFVSLDPGRRDILRPNPIRQVKELPLPHGKIDPAWFVRLRSGESITRTATEPAFAAVPPGRYRCILWYGYPAYSPGFFAPRLSRAERYREDGRVWLGLLRIGCPVTVKDPTDPHGADF